MKATPGGNFNTWKDIYLHTGQGALVFLALGTMIVAVRIQGRLGSNPNSEAGLIKMGNLFFMSSFIATGIAFWFSNAYKYIFWYVMFQEMGNAFYIFGWMFLAVGLKAIDRHLEDMQIGHTGGNKKTPWHIIMGVISVAIAAIWTLILSVGNKTTLVDLFGHQLCWSLVAYYASYSMYDAYVAMSLR